MKYCPYCGTGLPGVVSFCPECGAKLTDMGKTQEEKSEEKKMPDAGGPQKSRRKEKQSRQKEIQPVTDLGSYADEQAPEDDGYDGYYDDIRPIDEDVRQEKTDVTLIWKVVGIFVGLVVIIGACVALMYIL